MEIRRLCGFSSFSQLWSNMICQEMHIFCSILGTNIHENSLKRQHENCPYNEKIKKKGRRRNLFTVYLPVVAIREVGFLGVWVFWAYKKLRLDLSYEMCIFCVVCLLI